MAYNYAMLKMAVEIKKALKSERLTKSDDLEPGWTGEVPKIEVDMEKTIAPIIQKHLNAIKWALMGDYAGKECAEAAKEVGLKGKVTPGIVPSSFLSSVDAHREHYVDLNAEKAPAMPKFLIKEALSNIVKKSSRFFDGVLLEIKNKILSTLESVIDSLNLKNTIEVHEEAKNLSSEVGAEDAIQQAVDQIDARINKKDLDKEMNRLIESMESRFETSVRTQTSQSSAVGTHVSIMEIYGRESDDIRIVNIPTEDERLCSWCNKISKKPDGSWIYYKLKDLEPAGYNFSRKKDEWRPSFSPLHHNCRCMTVYVPSGFEVGPDGSLKPA